MSEALELPYVSLVPFAVFDDTILSPSAKLFYGCLAALSKREGYCWATDEQLAQMMKCSDRQVARWLDQLEGRGFIRRQTKNRPYRADDGKLLWRKERKIFVSDGFSKKVSDTDKNVPTNDTDKNVPTDDTDKNVPYKERISKEEISKEESHAASAAQRLAQLLWEKIRAIHPKARPPSMNTWVRDIERLLRIDDRTEHDVERVITWALADDFWCRNILSGRKLREKFDQLYISMTKQTQTPQHKEQEATTQKMAILNNNKRWATEFFKGGKKVSGSDSMELLENGVKVFFNGNHAIIGFLENGFIEQVRNIHRKMTG